VIKRLINLKFNYNKIYIKLKLKYSIIIMKIGPDVWGPHGWKFLHFVALAYPNEPTEDDKKHYKQFFELLQFMLPCSLCANNYKDHIYNDLPITDEVLKNKDTFVKWTVDIHNMVNEQTGKPKLSLEEALKLIYNNYMPETNVNSNFNTGINYDFNNNISNNKNVLELKAVNKKDDDEDDDKDNKKQTNTFTSLSFWLIVFAVLITIAIVYKKG